jgi:RNA polymerase sigma-70 factor (ECF subfamily)
MINLSDKRKNPDTTFNTNEFWVKSLTSPADEKVIAELRSKLIQGLKPALRKYVDRELDAFVEDIAQDSVLKILDKLQSFRGESAFTTWALKIAVREGLSELRRKKWNDISLHDLNYNSDENNAEIRSPVFSSSDPHPDQLTHEHMVLEQVMEIIDHQLSEKQKTAVHALLVQGMSSTVVAERMGLSRNALYKLIFDGRMSIKKKLEEAGIDVSEILQDG